MIFWGRKEKNQGKGSPGGNSKPAREERKISAEIKTKEKKSGRPVYFKKGADGKEGEGPQAPKELNEKKKKGDCRAPGIQRKESFEKSVKKRGGGHEGGVSTKGKNH